MIKSSARRRTIGIPLIPLLLVYLAIALAPLALSAVLGIPRRSFGDELASAAAMVAFAMLLMEFVLSGRFRIISDRIGIDLTMRFHQLIAWVLLAFLLVHPLLYQTPWFASPSALPGSGLGLTGWSALSGATALLLLLGLVVLGAFRDQSGSNYEGWRIVHGFGAVAIAVLGMHHTLVAGYYSNQPVLAAYWIVLFAAALLSFAYVHLLTPLRQLRAPYRVTSVQQVALRTWELTVEPVDRPALEFTAGQFVWLTLGRSPFAITEHPFTISSSPAERPRISFTIKEAGDFTHTVGRIPVGTRAYLDGAHGSFVLPGREAAGLAFIAGGVGLAPIVSLLRSLRSERDRRPMVLIYGNRVEQQIMYRAELDALANELDIAVHYALSEPPADWSGMVGELDEAVLRRCLEGRSRDRWLYFVCGPTPMIDSVERTLGKLGVPLRQVVSEKFKYD
jgi:predicted ferric reductase